MKTVLICFAAYSGEKKDFFEKYTEPRFKKYADYHGWQTKIVKDYSEYEPLKEYIFNFKDDILKDVFIFDYFLNEKNNEIKIGFRFIFQDSNSTITETQVNNIMNVIIKNTIKDKSVTIPGL